MELQVPILTEYFDINEYSSNPMKPNFNNLHYQFNPSLSQIYQIKVAENFGVTHDSWLQSTLSNRNTSYISTSFSGYLNSDIDISLANPRDFLLRLTFVADSKVQTITRTRLTIWDVLGIVGGLFSVMAGVLGVIVRNF